MKRARLAYKRICAHVKTVHMYIRVFKCGKGIKATTSVTEGPNCCKPAAMQMSAHKEYACAQSIHKNICTNEHR